MAKPNADSRPQMSVFDRLLDDQPKNRQETPPPRLHAIRLYRESVSRDLESLLNARANPWMPGPEFPQLRSSVYTYGLPYFSNLSTRSPEECSRLTRQIAQAIEQHEPRLARVQVDLVTGENDQLAMQVRFKVSALLLMDPSPEQVTFDTVLELSRGEYAVKGE